MYAVKYRDRDLYEINMNTEEFKSLKLLVDKMLAGEHINDCHENWLFCNIRNMLENYNTETLDEDYD